MSEENNNDPTKGIDEDVLASLYFLEPDGNELDDASTLYSEIHKNTQRYKTISFLGKGGMKDVYKVYDNQLGIHVAKATPLEEFSKDIYEVFLEEARLTSKLQHPNIIAIHDIGINKDGSPYFTMDLKSGLSLWEILKKDKKKDLDQQSSLSTEERLSIFIKVCDAIAYAHNNGVLHLDLKPSNIQIGNFGEVLVCDWGIGKVLNIDDDSSVGPLKKNYDDGEEKLLNSDYLKKITLQGKISGTPGYISPEQINGNKKSYHTDVYGLGCLLYTLITDKAPFSGTVKQQLDAAAKGEFESPQKRFPEKNISQSLNAVIMKAMNLNPKNRYENAQDFRNDINKVLNFHPTDAESFSMSSQLKLLYKRRLHACNAIIGAFLLICIITLSFINAINEEKTISTNNQHKAEKALKLLQEHKNFTVNLETAYEIEMKKDIFNFCKNGRFDLVEKLFEKIIKLNPNNKAFLKGKFITLIASHQFIEALSFQKNENINNVEVLISLCEKYSARKIGQQYLSLNDTIQMIRYFPPQENATLERLFQYEKVIQRPKKEIYKITLTLLKRINPKWKDSANNSVDFNNNTASFSGKGLIRFKFNRTSLLRYFNFRSLNLNKSDVFDLHFLLLSKMPLVELKIKDTLITNLRHAAKLKHLKFIHISKNQFTKEQLKILPKRISIVNL